jgi:hypothetical protein
MSYLGDTLTVGLIIVLLFGSIALYLYTRVQQTEQKVSLLESIVLDLKLTGEIQQFTPLSDDLSPSLVSASLVPASPVSASPVSASPVSASPVSSSPVSASPAVEAKEEYTPFQDEEDGDEPKAELLEDSGVEFLPLDSEPVHEMAAVAFSYSSMSLKELQAEVRSRGLPLEKGAKKHALVELLKQHDARAPIEAVSEVKPGLTSSPVLLESQPLSQDDE